MYLSLTALFAAAAMVITIGGFEVCYPLLPYLKFDFAEIPATISYFIAGFYSSIIVATAHWFFLMYSRGDVLGPSMKYMAVLSMLIGYHVSSIALRKFSSRGNSYFSISVSIALGCLFRVIVMTFSNIIVLSFIAPGYLDFAAMMIERVIGKSVNHAEALYWTCVFTGIYNAIHVLFSFVPALIIVKVIRRRLGTLMSSAFNFF